MDTQNNNNQTNLVIKRQVQIEAVSKAIYMVTDLFDKDEPLRMSLRRSAIECVENTNSKASILQLISLIRLSKELGLITDMNADILLDVLKGKVTELDNSDDKQVVDLSNLSAHVNNEDDKETESGIKIKEDISHVSIQKPVSDRKVQPTASITIHNSTHNVKTINNISMDIGSRRKKIMEIVRVKGAVTINEFMDAIKGCSSKTIQRELTSLVLSGNLKKTGERRWSKYSLK